MADEIPYLKFDSADVPAGEGRGRWAAMIGAYDVALLAGQAETDFAVTSESWLLGQILVSHGRLTPVELIRSAQRIAADGRDTYTFGLVTHGHLAGDFDGRLCELRPGQVCVIDFARPWRASTASTEFILLSVSRPALSRQSCDLHGRLLDGATARLLTEHCIALVRHLPQASAADAAVIQRTTLRMVADSLERLAPAENGGPGSLEGRLTYRVRGYIEDNLGLAGLSPASLCQALGISRPTLYRAFRPSGGVMNYIRRRRLESVHLRLSDASDSRTVSKLALSFGFSSHAHFSTAFRRRFGYAPRDARQGAGSHSASAAGAQFQSWLLDLAAQPGAE